MVGRAGAARVAALAMVVAIGTVGCGSEPPAAAPTTVAPTATAAVPSTTTTVPSGPTPVGDVLPFTWAAPDVALPIPEGFVQDGSGTASVRFADGRVLQAEVTSCTGSERWYVYATGTTPDGYAFALSVNNDYALTPKGYADVHIKIAGDPARVDESLGGAFLSGMLPIEGDATGSPIGPGWLGFTVRTVDGQTLSGARLARDAGEVWKEAKGPPPGEGWTLSAWQRYEAYLAAEVYPGLHADGLAVQVESVELLVGMCDD